METQGHYLKKQGKSGPQAARAPCTLTRYATRWGAVLYRRGLGGGDWNFVIENMIETVPPRFIYELVNGSTPTPSEGSHASSPHDIAHIQHTEEEDQNKASLKPKDELPPVTLSEVQTLVKSIKTKRHPGLNGIDTNALTELDDVSEQEFLKAPPFLPYCTLHTITIFYIHHQASNSRYSRTIPRFIFVPGGSW
ncbi:hypothetical protein EVAR_102128_1 [Eumeta japonica]|uniref:Uncharacterized protein n=1 Tax=Eumeta variegata TaxID=151549 RepID=A0A4C1U017_EUMVA|nr:hypothetical protein EVAR_102128_1 [Eumeta japonica]